MNEPTQPQVKAVPQATQPGATIKQTAQPLPANPAVQKVNIAAAPAPAQSAAPAFKIESSKDRKRYTNTLLYGDYGVGKTTLAASASEVPEMRDVLFVNAEGGDESIIGYYDYDGVPVTSFMQFARVYEYLRMHCKHRDLWTKEKDQDSYKWLMKYEALLKGLPEGDIKEPKLYHTVIIDSLTEVQKYCMYQLLGIKVGEFALDIAPEQPEWAEWGKSAEMIRLLVRTFRDLPIHTIFVCGMGTEQDNVKKFHYAPLLPGKLANEVLGFFDTVGFMTAGMTEGGEMLRRLWLEPGLTYKAKNRFRNFEGRYIDNPTMAELIKLGIK